MEEQPVPSTETTESNEAPKVPVTSVATLPSRATSASQKRTTMRGRWLDALIALGIFSVTVGIALLFAVHYSWLSPLDEGVHFDYVYKITQGQLVPTPGQVISDETLKEIKCRPSLVYPLPNCNGTLTKNQIPVSGVNYVLAYGETFYLPAAAIATMVHAISPTSWLMSARAASALFYALGAAALYLVARVYRASRPAAAGVALALAGCSMLFVQGGTVTPDSMACLAGAAAALVPVLRIPWRWRMAVAVVVGVLIAFIKPNLVPLGCVVVMLAGIIPENDDSPFSVTRILFRLRTLATLALAVIPLVLALVWNAWENSRLPVGVRADGGLNDMLHYNGPFLHLLFEFATGMFDPLGAYALVPSYALTALGRLMTVMIVGGALMIAMNAAFDRRPRLKLMAVGGIVAIALTGIYVPLVLYVTYHATGGQPRYVIPAYALLVAPVAASLNGRVARWLILVLGVVTVVAAFTAVRAIH